MVKNFHAAGIEVILDVVYNHTAEGGRTGPTYCLPRARRPRLLQARPATVGDTYWDVTGCGNTVDSTEPRRAAADPRLAALLGDRDARRRLPVRPGLGAGPHRARHRHAQRVPHRDRPGPGAAAREADRRAVGRDDGRLPGRLVPAAVGGVERPVPRHRARLLARRAPAASATRLAAGRLVATCTPTTAARRTPRSTSSPPTTASRCATWSPTTHKHNEANGEDNRDGTDNNRSLELRRRGRDRRRGDPGAAPPAGRQHDGHAAACPAASPMLTAGDERGRTQRGNNNAYCQDNEISWVDWRPDDAWLDLYEIAEGRAAAAARAPGAAPAAPLRRQPRRSRAARRTWPGCTPTGREMTERRLARRRAARVGMFVSGDPLRSPGPRGEQQRDASFLLWLNAGPSPVDGRACPRTSGSAHGEVVLATDPDLDAGTPVDGRRRCSRSGRGRVLVLRQTVQTGGVEAQPRQAGRATTPSSAGEARRSCFGRTRTV